VPSREEHEARLDAAARAIVEGVRAAAPRWIVAEVQRIAGAWGRLDDRERARLVAEASEVARAATDRVAGALEELFARPPAEQRTTPLAILRTIVREPTELLQAAGIPAIQRDAFEERAFPDDHYGLTPANLDVLGDPGLGPHLLAWGLAKAALVRGDA
jgi:hypothetical protein